MFYEYHGSQAMQLIFVALADLRLFVEGLRPGSSGGLAAEGRKLREVHRSARAPCECHPLMTLPPFRDCR